MTANLASICVLFTLFMPSLHAQVEDSGKTLIRAVENLSSQDHPSVDSLWQVSQKYMQEVSDTSVAHLNQVWGSYYNDNYQFDSAKVLVEEAVRLYRKYDDKKNLAYTLHFLGNICYDIEDISGAISNYHSSLSLYEDLGMTAKVASLYNGIANAYAYISDFNLAFDNYERAVERFKEVGDSSGVSMVYGNAASIHISKKDYDKATETYQTALRWGKSANRKLDSYLGLGVIKAGTGDYEKAEEYYHEAKSLALEVKDFIQLAYVYQNLAFLHIKKNELDSVPRYISLIRDLADKYSIGGMQYNLDELEHEFLYKKGEYRAAYELLKKTRAESDSFYDLDMTRQLQEVQAEYSTLRKEKELAQKNLELEKTASALQRNEYIRNGLIGGILLIILVVILIIRSHKLKTKANQQLRLKNAQIEEKNKEIIAMEEAKSKWFINISHELRTPLTLIKGPVRHALQSIPPKDHIYYDLRIADRNVTRLQKLVDEILDISKMESGKMPLNLSNVNLTELVLNALASFDSAARNTKVKLELDLDTDNPLVCRVDEEKVNNVIINLVSNALKFTHEGGQITAGVSLHDDVVRMYVKDTGEGIPEEDLDKIFNRFYQASNSSGRQGGTGVGLALCKEIAKMHQGDLTVTSKYGEGSVFELSFPYIVPLEDAMPPAEEAEKEKTNFEEFDSEVPAEYRSKLKDKKILVVDDNADMREYISGFLKKDFEIIEARDGLEALEILRNETPDLIVSDIMMPRMDGQKFAREVKAHPRWKFIPFITVSAIGDEHEKVKTLRTGIDDYLVKPFYAEELLVRIQNLIYNYSERVTTQQEESEEVEISHEEKILKRLEQEVYDNIEDPNFNVIRLAEVASMSERQLYRYIKQMTGLTPASFIREIRLQRAMDLIQKRVYRRTSQLSYAVGFQQPAYFSTVFKKRFGRLPAEYIED